MVYSAKVTGLGDLVEWHGWDAWRQYSRDASLKAHRYAYIMLLADLDLGPFQFKPGVSEIFPRKFQLKF